MSRKYKFHDPVKHGFTNSAECYDWSSAIDYAGGKGIVEIEMIYMGYLIITRGIK